MTFWQAVGGLMLASPFVGGAVFVVRDGGWRAFAEIFGGAAALVTLIGVGAALLNGDLP